MTPGSCPAGLCSLPCQETPRGDEASVPPPSRVTPGRSPWGCQPRELCGAICPCAGAGSFPCQPCLHRLLLLQPPLPQRAGYSTLIPSAGCRGKGIFILAGYPPCFFSWVVLPPPKFWRSPHGPGAQIQLGAEGGQGCSGCAFLAQHLPLHPASSTHCTGPAIPPCLSLLEHRE